MVVQYTPKAEYAAFATNSERGKGYAMVMCPVSAVDGRVRDVKGTVVNPTEGGKGEEGGYLCAMVAPAVLPGSFGIAVWRQVVVGGGEMEEEVLMEWDEATRYYYLTV